MADLQALLRQSSAMHKHLCPRQVLGARMGLYAAQLLGLELPQSDKRLFAFVETDGCFADGVSVATGCWLGRRTLRLMDFGKTAATFVDTKTDRCIRIWPHPMSRERASRSLPGAQSRWHAQLDAYQRLPAADLLCYREVALSVSLDEIISRAGVRVNCAACGEEIINEREVVLLGQPLCRGCAGENYWRTEGGETWSSTALEDSLPTFESR
jgi:formylmethanofuran dehydrogenase subunit E